MPLESAPEQALEIVDRVIANTDVALKQHPDCERPLRRYVAGVCDFNERLSKKQELDEEQVEFDNALGKVIPATKAFDQPINLFHGFEPWLNYGEGKWKVGDRVQFPFYLSKTLAPWVAKEFAGL